MPNPPQPPTASIVVPLSPSQSPQAGDWTVAALALMLAQGLREESLGRALGASERWALASALRPKSAPSMAKVQPIVPAAPAHMSPDDADRWALVQRGRLLSFHTPAELRAAGLWEWCKDHPLNHLSRLAAHFP